MPTSPEQQTANIRAMQARLAVPADGDFGPRTLAAFLALADRDAMTEAQRDTLPDGVDLDTSAKPAGARSLTNAERIARFGSFAFETAPVPGMLEAIRITSRSPEFKIAEVHLPQLVGVQGFPKSGKVLFHAGAAGQLVALVHAWDEAGLLGKVLSWGGSYVPRYVRGSKTSLSNHSWGTAFDINAAWNGLGKEPVKAGATGSVRELVSIAYKLGFYWGGWFPRPDGMHFEVGPRQ
jgi:hypothetical protein